MMKPGAHRPRPTCCSARLPACPSVRPPVPLPRSTGLLRSARLPSASPLISHFVLLKWYKCATCSLLAPALIVINDGRLKAR